MVGRGAAPNPAKGRRPLEPLLKAFGQEGATQGLPPSQLPLLPERLDLNGIEGASPPSRVQGSALALAINLVLRHIPPAGENR